MLHQFGLRHGSAGLGKWHGGEGVIRELEVLEPMQVSILSEVRFKRSYREILLTLLSDAQGSLTAWRAEARVRLGGTHG